MTSSPMMWRTLYDHYEERFLRPPFAKWDNREAVAAAHRASVPAFNTPLTDIGKVPPSEQPPLSELSAEALLLGWSSARKEQQNKWL